MDKPEEGTTLVEALVDSLAVRVVTLEAHNGILLGRIKVLEHDLGALQAYCDYGLQETLRTMAARIKALETLGLPANEPEPTS